MKQRRKWWQWLADKAGIQARVDYAEKMSWFRMGIAKASGGPARLTPWDYPPDEQVSVQFLAPPPQSGAYEPPSPNTDPTMKPLPKSARDVARERGYQTSMTRPVGIPPHLRRAGK